MWCKQKQAASSLVIYSLIFNLLQQESVRTTTGETQMWDWVIYFLDYLLLIHFYKYRISLLFCAADIRLPPPLGDK